MNRGIKIVIIFFVVAQQHQLHRYQFVLDIIQVDAALSNTGKMYIGSRFASRLEAT